jgi:hypothetical protein
LRLFWDNAYAVHDLYDTTDPLVEILAACAKAGNPNRPLEFASTSKISFAGAGVAVMATSAANVADAKKHLAIQSIGPDKVNQLRHVRFFQDAAGLKKHMQKHAELLRPKFDAVTRIFERELGGSGLAAWTKPRGGYFVSLDTLDGLATEIVRLADEAGVKLTPAGATFPLGKDPQNRNIRVAPSLPPASQGETAMEVVALCVPPPGARKLAGRGLAQPFFSVVDATRCIEAELAGVVAARAREARLGPPLSERQLSVVLAGALAPTVLAIVHRKLHDVRDRDAVRARGDALVPAAAAIVRAERARVVVEQLPVSLTEALLHGADG